MAVCEVGGNDDDEAFEVVAEPVNVDAVATGIPDRRMTDWTR